MRRSAVLALVLGACALGATAWLALGSEVRDVVARGTVARPGDPVATSNPPVSPDARSTRSRVSKAHVSPASAIVLPPTDVALAPVMPVLVAAARRGDVGAMCRLSFELKRCHDDLPKARRAVESLTETIAESVGKVNGDLIRVDGKWVTPDRAAFLAKHTATRDKLEAICAGISPPPGLPPWRLLRDAARAGHLPSMVRYAMGPSFLAPARLADLDALRAFRDEAPGLLRRAVAMGDPSAAYAMMSAYRGNGMVASTGRVPEDPGLALAYALALRGVGNAESERSVNDIIASLRRKLDAAQQRAAEQAALALSAPFAELRGTSVDLQQGFKPWDGSECEQPPQTAAHVAPVPDDAPIAPVAD